MKTKDDKKKFLDELEKTPFVLHASKKVGIDKATIYRWRKKDKKFAKEMDQALSIGIASVCDIAEGQLTKMINQGDFKSIKFFLENNKKEYIRPRAVTIINTAKGNSSVLTNKERERLDKLLNSTD